MADAKENRFLMNNRHVFVVLIAVAVLGIGLIS